MGCHEKALERYRRNILRDRKNADFWLDEWFDSITRATEWDADQWGFKADDWLTNERAIMEERISRCKHKHAFREPCKHGNRK